MAKEPGAATIVLLIGTSSAGKGVIINEMKKQDGLRPPEDQLEWQEDGLDIENHKHKSLPELHSEVIASNSASQVLFDELSPVLTGQLEINIAI